MYQFNYQRPESIDEARSMLSKAEDGLYLAGGHTLIPALKQRLSAPSDLVDLSSIAELKGVSIAGGVLRIGALTTHADVAGSPEVISHCGALSDLAGGIGDAQVRNRGTIGGSVANNDPAADYPAALLALNATVHTDQRDIPAEEFFTGMFETALLGGELITAISFAGVDAASYVKFPSPASRYAMVGVMVAKTSDGVRVAITGASPCVFRATAMEEALKCDLTADALDGVRLDAEALMSDMHASADYRAQLCTVMAKQAVRAITGD